MSTARPSQPGGNDTAAQVAQNRATWDRWADLNFGSDFYDVASFKAGRNALDNIELEGVGDVAGKRLLHLQCHFGMGTISFARMGATVTGVDLSERAIELARSLAQELEIPATFICADVADATGVLEAGAFDIVFVSYGAISWLPDLRPWARTIAHALAPGGTLFVVDHHPALWIFDDTTEERVLRYRYPYFSREALRDEAQGNYADPSDPHTHVSYSWQHTFEEIVSALRENGMRITALREYDRIAWAWFPWMEKDEDGLWRMPDDMGSLPLMFSVTAVREE